MGNAAAHQPFRELTVLSHQIWGADQMFSSATVAGADVRPGHRP